MNRFQPVLCGNVFLLTIGFFWPTLYGLWTTIMRQTQMPGIPISAVAANARLGKHLVAKHFSLEILKHLLNRFQAAAYRAAIPLEEVTFCMH